MSSPYRFVRGTVTLGRAGCDGERIPRDKLEAAVLRQLASLYRDGALIRKALDEAAAREQAGRPALEERRGLLAEEIRRAERASTATTTHSKQASSTPAASK